MHTEHNAYAVAFKVAMAPFTDEDMAPFTNSAESCINYYTIEGFSNAGMQ